jgi:hypothetical protein
MRGSFDDVVNTSQQPPPGAEGNGRVPGGKALARLLQVLERSGLDAMAEQTAGLVVPHEQRSEFLAKAKQFSAAPDRAEGTGNGSADSGDIAQEYFEVGQRIAGPPVAGPQWREVGPWTIPNGQTYGSSRVNVSGRVSAIAMDPLNPAHVLVGAANGGIWESRDRGASWRPRSDYASTLAIGALAFDPVAPATVYCGTGEGDWWSWLGQGVLRSTDGGTTWSPRCTAPFVGQGFHDLIVDRAATNRLFAATTGGLYVSTDSGATWTQRRAVRTWSLATPTAGSTEILAACQDGARRSTDNGVTWNAVALPGAPATFTRLAVAIAPSDPTVAYAWGAAGTVAYLWRRAGGTWTAVAPPPGVAVGQAWYDWFLEVAPDLATQVYCGAIEVHRGEESGTTWTWRNLTNKGTTGDSIHPDQHVAAFEPGRPATVYIGNDGGVYRSDDRGITWQHCNNGLVITEFEYLAQDYGSSRFIVGGTQDNGSERFRGSSVFDHIADGDGGDCGVNRTDPRIVFHSYYGMSLERSTSSGDWGTWTWIAPPVPTGEGSLFYPPFETSASTGDTIAMGGDALYISRNNGTAWTRLPFPSAARSSAMFMPYSDAVYVGTTDGRIFRTQWNGTSWPALTQLTTPRAGAAVSDLYVHPALKRIWATSSRIGGGRVFRSDDGGTTWVDRTAGLPALPINAVEVDNADGNRVWVAADLGVYQSRDAGATWADYSNALPNCYIGDLVLQPHARVLRAGTRNRGIWEIPVDGWMTQPVCGVQWNGTLAGNASGRWFSWGWPATWHVLWTIMPTTPRPGGPQVSWTVQVERANAEYATYWITVQNLTPDPVSFEGRYCILSRY